MDSFVIDNLKIVSKTVKPQAMFKTQVIEKQI